MLSHWHALVYIQALQIGLGEIKRRGTAQLDLPPYYRTTGVS
jgi:hypothetical protein